MSKGLFRYMDIIPNNKLEIYSSREYEAIYQMVMSMIKTNLSPRQDVIFKSLLLTNSKFLLIKGKKQGTDEDELKVVRQLRIVTRDENRFPLDVVAVTFDNTQIPLTYGEYVEVYNPIPIAQIETYVQEISELREIIKQLRKLYRVPAVILAKDAKQAATINDLINKLESSFDIAIAVQDYVGLEERIKDLQIKTPYITDKLLDEIVSLRQYIKECFGIFKAAPSGRERVNTTELLMLNSDVNIIRLGMEEVFDDLEREVKKTFDLDLDIQLVMSKVLDQLYAIDTKTIREDVEVEDEDEQ